MTQSSVFGHQGQDQGSAISYPTTTIERYYEEHCCNKKPLIMNTQTNPSLTTEENSPLENALQLEITVLHTLIGRSRAQHRRALYFRRLEMFMKCYNRYSLNHIHKITKSSGYLRRYLMSISSGSKKSRLSKEEEEDDDEEWTILSMERKKSKGDHNNNIIDEEMKKWKNEKKPVALESLIVPTSNLNGNKKKKKMERESLCSLTRHVQWLYCICFKYLPECLSRLEYTCEAFYREIANGFFLPYCSVVVAALARIRVILMRFGREAVKECIDIVTFSSKLTTIMNHSDSSTKEILLFNYLKEVLEDCNFSAWMNQFMEIDKDWQPGTKRNNNDRKLDDDKDITDLMGSDTVDADNSIGGDVMNNKSTVSPNEAKKKNVEEDFGESVNIDESQVEENIVRIVPEDSDINTNIIHTKNSKKRKETSTNNVVHNDDDNITAPKRMKESKDVKKRIKSSKKIKKEPQSKEEQDGDDNIDSIFSDLTTKDTSSKKNTKCDENSKKNEKKRKKKDKKEKLNKSKKKKKKKDIFDDIFS